MGGISPYLCGTITENPTMNVQSKIETIILNKIKSLGPIKFESTYGEGEIIVKKLSIETLYSNGRPYRLHLEVAFHGNTSKCRWESPQYAGRRRNDDIRSQMIWRQNDIKLMVKVFGINQIQVNKITVKKKEGGKNG
jgi:hypothetical protein